MKLTYQTYQDENGDWRFSILSQAISSCAGAKEAMNIIVNLLERDYQEKH